MAAEGRFDERVLCRPHVVSFSASEARRVMTAHRRFIKVMACDPKRHSLSFGAAFRSARKDPKLIRAAGIAVALTRPCEA